MFTKIKLSTIEDGSSIAKVVGASQISTMEIFSRCNHIAMHEDNNKSITFTMLWVMFMYDKMPFKLMNAGANFQRAVDISFVGEREKFIVIYLDDMNVFSKSDKKYLEHLKQVFLKCKKMVYL